MTKIEAGYHYCSGDKFQKIIESGEIWLGRLSAMNDYMEHSWLRTKALAVIDQCFGPDLLDIKELRKAELRRRDFYNELKRLLQLPAKSDPYCACFSREGDVLSQWRAYADGGAGFSIGFSLNFLSLGQAPQLPETVNYDEEDQEALIRTVLHHAEKFIGATGLRKDPEAFAAEIEHLITYIAMTCKNPAFDEEDEIRVLYDASEFDPPQIEGLEDWTAKFDLEIPLIDHFVTIERRMLHFLKLKFRVKEKDDSILEIVLGPTNPARQDRKALEKFLLRYRYDGVPIRESAATLR